MGCFNRHQLSWDWTSSYKNQSDVLIQKQADLEECKKSSSAWNHCSSAAFLGACRGKSRLQEMISDCLHFPRRCRVAEAVGLMADIPLPLRHASTVEQFPAAAALSSKQHMHQPSTESIAPECSHTHLFPLLICRNSTNPLKDIKTPQTLSFGHLSLLLREALPCSDGINPP